MNKREQDAQRQAGAKRLFTVHFTIGSAPLGWLLLWQASLTLPSPTALRPCSGNVYAQDIDRFRHHACVLHAYLRPHAAPRELQPELE